MNDQRIQFGTDGWRALLGSHINLDTISVVAQAFVESLPEITEGSSKEIIIGYDGRQDSDIFALQFARIALTNGWMPVLSDRIIPTPVVSFSTKDREARAGVMITASHNPAEYNGIKFKSSAGAPFSSEMTTAVEKNLGIHPVKHTQHPIQTIDLWSSYRVVIESIIDLKLIRDSGLKVAIDSMAGAGAQFLEQILSDLGVIAKTIDGTPLKDFGGRLAEPIAQNLRPLQTFLSKTPGFSIGLATDGDADRLGICYEDGSWQNAQDTIMSLGHYMVTIRKTPGDLVKTASVTNRIQVLGERENRQVHNVQVGFKYIADEMQAGQIVFGAEESGGYGFGIHIPERDGIFSALIALEMLARTGSSTLSEYQKIMGENYGQIFYQRVDLPISEPDTGVWLGELSDRKLTVVGSFAVTNQEIYQNSRGWVNGLKFYLAGENRWLLLRSSETEPLVRIYAEGDSSDEPFELLELGKSLFQSVGVTFLTK